MSIFPHIKHLNDILPAIEGKEYIGVLAQKNGSTVLCYNVSNSMSFATALEKECRGITFGEDGQIICRSMHKFFNLNERAGYQINELDWADVHAVYDKMDGSMINTGFYQGELFAKSKKSFTSPVAVSAKAYIERNDNYRDFCLYCVEIGVTPTFEYTSPLHRIVLDYKVEALTLLQVREMVSGEYWAVEKMREVAQRFNVSFNEPLWSGDNFDIEKALEVLNSADEMEGYVIQFKNGDMVKVKSKWYVNLHHAVTFIRERDIAELVLNETIDDFIAFIQTNRPNADLTRVNEINNQITSEIAHLKSETDKLVKENAHLSFKDMAAQFKNHPLSSFVLRTARGQEVDYIKWYRMNRLKSWPLDPLEMGVNDYHSLSTQKEND